MVPLPTPAADKSSRSSQQRQKQSRPIRLTNQKFSSLRVSRLESSARQRTHRDLRLFARNDRAKRPKRPETELRPHYCLQPRPFTKPTKKPRNLSDMALRPRTTKRARPQTSPTAKHVSDDHLSMYFRQPGLVENQHDDQPRRKRAMVSANLRFLEKMPPLRDYQRGRFGRRGGVDGGAPDAGSSLWMQALEESMEETSFVTREASTCAALVAPVPIPVDNRRNSNFVPVPVAVMGAGRVGMPATSTTRFSTADEEAIGRRRLFALQAARGGGKDDEARPATEGLAL